MGITLRISLPAGRAREFLRVKVPKIDTMKLSRSKSSSVYDVFASQGYNFYGAFSDGRRLLGAAYKLEMEGRIVKVVKSPAWLRREDPKTGLYFLYYRRARPGEKGGSGWGIVDAEDLRWMRTLGALK